MKKTNTDDLRRAVTEQALKATCLRAKCGAIIVADGEIIGRGFNSPAADDESQRMCLVDRSSTIKPKYDRTCCMHAEWRAILDALKHHPKKVTISSLYYIRLDVDTNEIVSTGRSFCTVCSRMIYDSGVSEMIICTKTDKVVRSASEFNKSSYDYLLR